MCTEIAATPPSNIKNIPESVKKRLSYNSFDEVQFEKSKHPFQTALDENAYKYKLEYKPSDQNKTKCNRPRNTT